MHPPRLLPSSALFGILMDFLRMSIHRTVSTNGPGMRFLAMCAGCALSLRRRAIAAGFLTAPIAPRWPLGWKRLSGNAMNVGAMKETAIIHSRTVLLSLRRP